MKGRALLRAAHRTPRPRPPRGRTGPGAAAARQAERLPVGPRDHRPQRDVHRLDARDQGHQAHVDALRPLPAHPSRRGLRRDQGPGLGVWQKSSTGRSGFIFKKRVQGLAAPGEYKAVVRFRWRQGRPAAALDQAQDAVCAQPDQRPTCVPARSTSRAGRSPTGDLCAVVTNDGRSAAGPFDVALAVNGADQPAQRVGRGPRRGRRADADLRGAALPGGHDRCASRSTRGRDRGVERDQTTSSSAPARPSASPTPLHWIQP